MSDANQLAAPFDSDAVVRFIELTEALNEDVAALIKHAQHEATALSRRSVVRATFASIEGLIAATKGLIVESLPHTREHFTDAEIALLHEESYALTDKGDAVVQTRFLRLEDNLRFVWKMFVREWRIDPEIDFSSEGWRAFTMAVKIRNRITHPRRPQELSISDAEYSLVQLGYQFVYGMTMRNIFRSLQAARQQIYEVLDRLLPRPALEWLDGLEQVGSSPVERLLTPPEARDLSMLRATCRSDLLNFLTNWDLIGGPDSHPLLLQRGADYRAWRSKKW